MKVKCIIIALASIAMLASGCSKESTSSKLLEYKGYECTQDCSGHDAGYDWAQKKGINSVSNCGGKSNSFIEGCKSYVEEN